MIDHNYRNNSSAFTGRAPRTISERWPDMPVSRLGWPGFWHRLLVWLVGH